MKELQRSAVGAASLLLAGLLVIGCGGGGSPTGDSGAFSFSRPAAQQLSQAGAVEVELRLPPGGSAGGLSLALDGVALGAPLAINGGIARATIPDVPPGQHRLSAEIQADGRLQSAETSFETVELHDPDDCEVLNPEECLLPYPSSRFLEPADTPTGFRVSFPAGGMPRQSAAPLDPTPYGALDGFSPTVQILMLFPGGIDPARSEAPRLLPATRTTDLRSLEPESPTVLLDWDTGERVLHFIEPDARAAAVPERQVLFLRPGRSLTPGHRYLVAARRLVHPDGTPAEAPAPFAVLRDTRPTDIPAIESRREHFEAIFDRLGEAGVERDDLQLAFDFTVQSDESLTGQMLAMRDQAFAWLDERAAAGVETFTVGEVKDRACDAGSSDIGRTVFGTYEVPLFLTADPIRERDAPGTLRVDASGTPLQAGTMQAPFTVTIPCTALGDGGVALLPVVRGHGLLDDNRRVIDQPNFYDVLPPLDLIQGATDWSGFALADVLFFYSVFADLDRVAALADRGRQGILNALVLGRMMKRGVFNDHAAFQRSGGRGVFAGPDREMFYAGGSLGGYLGIAFAALSPDVTNVYADVGGINLVSLTLDRSAEGGQLHPDPLIHALLLGLAHELLVRADGAGYATHVTENPLPGSSVKNVLLTMGWLDQYTPNAATELAARTLELPSLDGSLLTNVPQLPDQPGPLASAFVIYDTGTFDLDHPTYADFIPPLANLPARDPVEGDCEPHSVRIQIPAAAEQLKTFLRPGGRIESFCNGRCDAGEALELPGGAVLGCDPRSP